MWSTFFIAAMCFNNAQRFFYCVFIEIIAHNHSRFRARSLIELFAGAS